MEKRFFLALSLSIAVFLIWSQYFAPPLPENTGSQQQTANYTNSIPTSNQTDKIPATPESIESQSSVNDVENLPAVELTPIPERRTITITAPLYVVSLDTQGARITSWLLTKHNDKDGNPIEMISPEDPLTYPGDVRVNNDSKFFGARFSSNIDEDNLYLSATDEPISVELTAQLPSGEQLKKVYMFHPENYLVNLDVTLTNLSKLPVGGRLDYVLPNKLLKTMDGKATNRYIRSGPVFWNGSDRELPKMKNILGHMEFQNIRWAAIQENYFFAAVAPLNQYATGFVEPGTKKSEDGTTENAITGIILDQQQINPGDAIFQRVLLLMGPKKYDKLSEMNLGIENIVDFGWIEVLGKLFYKILITSVGYLKNYGLSIILITFCVKLLLFPLSKKQMESMKKMQMIQPQMKALQEKYKKEPQKQQQELGKLYKQHGVNPMGGCLPMFVQFPIFIALYQVLMNLIEMRGASFLWVSDLSQPNVILVLMMGASMVAQQKMTPTTGDPKQAKMMMFLPVIFTAMFWNFPAGLVLYWLTNNILTIGQQALMNRSSNINAVPEEQRLKARTQRKIDSKN